MDFNNFLYEAMSSYTKARKLSEINSDLENFISTEKEAILKTIGYYFSTLEGPLHFIGTGSYSEGLGTLGNDVDTLVVIPNKTITFSKDFKNTDLYADTKNSPKAFCRLVCTHKHSSSSFSRGTLLFVDNSYYLRRDLFLQEIRSNVIYVKEAEIQGPAFQLLSEKGAFPTEDFVLAIKCIDWPLECEDYFQRSRFWPNKEKVKEIRNQGIHVVFKAFSDDPNKNDPLEFRMSFSLAEKCLIRNFSDIQFATYYFLKVIKDDMAAKQETYHLKSYFIKITLIHYIENLSPELWTKGNFLRNAKSCLEKLLDCYKEKFLPHLFIKDCNLLSKYSNDECVPIIKDLSKLISNWDYKIKYMFFWKIKNISSSSGMTTRQQSSRILQTYKDAYESDYYIDNLSLCLEADELSLIIHRISNENNGRAFLGAVLRGTDALDCIMPRNFQEFYEVHLKRLLGILQWKNRISRKNTDLMLLLLHHYNVTITYPLSGFIDDVSCTIWPAFYSYILGRKEEARLLVNKITDIDTLSPVGYMSIFVSVVEQRYLYLSDSFFYNLTSKHLLTEDYCPINCLVLAHYLRAKTMKRNLLDHDTIEHWLVSIKRVTGIVQKVWKRETYRSILTDMISEIVRLLS